MAATVSIEESNGSGPTLTAAIANSNMGSADHADLDIANHPITANTNSYEKWQKFNVTNMGGSTKILTLKVWLTGSMPTGTTLKTNARESSYDGAQSFSQPSTTDRSATYDYTQTMPTSVPSGPNLGIGGSLTEVSDGVGRLVTTGKSDYLVMQIQTTASAVAGANLQMNYQYDEVS